ncbi:lactonizing lipase [Pseudomonas aeruginosa]|nr:lactonizing lipase [Pseudomonas aeruginosa]
MKEEVSGSPPRPGHRPRLSRCQPSDPGQHLHPDQIPHRAGPRHARASTTSSGSTTGFGHFPAPCARDGAQVYVTEVSQLDTSEVRGEQLLQQVGGKSSPSAASPRSTLIGHSHGGPTIPLRRRRTSRPDRFRHQRRRPAQGFGHRRLPAPRSLRVRAGEAVPLRAGQQPRRADQLPFQRQHRYAEFTGLAGVAEQRGCRALQRQVPAGQSPTSACGEGAYKVNGVSYYSWSGFPRR